MKNIVIGSIFVMFVVFGFAAGQFRENLPADPATDLTIEKITASEKNPQTTALDDKLAKNDSIFSWSTIISLNLALIAIVTFRHKTYF
jgi:hypothetical protein